MSITRQDVLPDPNYRIGDSGESTAGSFGPGFKSIKLSSESKIAKNITNSGRLVARSHGQHKWNIKVTYNPMTREEFEPVYNFLLHRQFSLKPFFVSLPHLRNPQDSTFVSYLDGGASVTISGDADSGSSSLMLNGFSSSASMPKPGDLFTITDTSSISHLKAYQIVQTQTNSTYDGTQPGTTQRKIEFIPPLTKDVDASASTINFQQPLIRVIMTKDIQEYALNTEGLYSFSLTLDEAQP